MTAWLVELNVGSRPQWLMPDGKFTVIAGRARMFGEHDKALKVAQSLKGLPSAPIVTQHVFLDFLGE